MSLSLDLGTKPDGLRVKTHGPEVGPKPTTVFLINGQTGETYDISIEDFLLMAAYVLTNTDLEPNDPRCGFVKVVGAMRVVDGYRNNGKRLSFTTSGWEQVICKGVCGCGDLDCVICGQVVSKEDPA